MHCHCYEGQGQGQSWPSAGVSLPPQPSPAAPLVCSHALCPHLAASSVFRRLISSWNSRSMASLGSSLMRGLFWMFLARLAYLQPRKRMLIREARAHPPCTHIDPLTLVSSFGCLLCCLGAESSCSAFSVNSYQSLCTDPEQEDQAHSLQAMLSSLHPLCPCIRPPQRGQRLVKVPVSRADVGHHDCLGVATQGVLRK